jgi:DNA-binding beta-propeller fold protein YncE
MYRRILVLVVTIGVIAAFAVAQAPAAGPYKVVKTAKVGGDGGFDYVYADSTGRKLYVPRTGSTPRVDVFNLDTLEPAGGIPNTNARGAAADGKSGHGFASSKPVAMWDTKTLALIKTIDVQGGPDGILADPDTHKIYVFSHSVPHLTVIDAADGTISTTLDLGGAPEQAVVDGKGHLYVDIEDKDKIAVVDTKTWKVTGNYDLAGKGGTPAGLAIDAKNRILFAACRNPAVMVMLNADTGAIITTLPLGAGTDGAVFNPATMEAFSSQGDGTLTVIKEKSPTSFEVEQTVQTPVRAKTLTLDSKTNRILLITAEFAAPAPPPAGTPPPAPGGRGPRPQMVPDSFSIVVVGK